MRLTVTPLGAQSASAATVARSVVNYLEGGGSPAATLLSPSAGPGGFTTSYFADSIEGPGRWLGAGAAFRELGGAVEREAFQRVLEGRHPSTGERLVTARGSSQRGHLAVGTHAVFDVDGNAMYTVNDAAQLLGLSVIEVAGLVAAGSKLESHAPDDGGWIGSVRQADCSSLVPDREITRLLELAALPPDPERVRAEGQPDDLLGAPDVARLLGVTRQYAARLCARSEDSSGNSRRASLPSRRGDDGNFLIRRADLAEFAEKRQAPIARVGFDLTLTAEKSIGLLAMLSDGDRQPRFVRALQRANDTAVGYMDQFASVVVGVRSWAQRD